MSLRKQVIDLTTNAAGAGTATSPAPVSGELVEVRFNTPQLNSGTADYTVYRTSSVDGGTVLTASNTAAPFSVTGTALALTAADEYLTVKVAEAAANKAGTVTVYYTD